MLDSRRHGNGFGSGSVSSSGGSVVGCLKAPGRLTLCIGAVFACFVLVNAWFLLSAAATAGGAVTGNGNGNGNGNTASTAHQRIPPPHTIDQPNANPNRTPPLFEPPAVPAPSAPTSLPLPSMPSMPSAPTTPTSPQPKPVIPIHRAEPPSSHPSAPHATTPAPAPAAGSAPLPVAVPQQHLLSSSSPVYLDPRPSAKGHHGSDLHRPPTADAQARCDDDFDYGLLDRWTAQTKTLCQPEPDPAAPAAAAATPATVTAASTTSPASWLTCRSMSKPYMPPPTAPHTVCEAANIVLDVRRAHNALCLKHRPGYFCDGAASYYQYDSGFIRPALGCARTSEFQLGVFPRDHLMDLFDTWPSASRATDTAGPGDVDPRHLATATRSLLAAPAPSGSAMPGIRLEDGRTLVRVDGVTLFVTRERGEHKNLFHTLTDLLNAYSSLYQAAFPNPTSAAPTLYGAATAPQLDLNHVRVVFLDSHVPSRYDEMWNRAFSRIAPAIHIGELAKAAAEAAVFTGATTTSAGGVGGGGGGGGSAGDTASLLFPRAVFSTPGYGSLLFAALQERDSRCPYRLDVISGFVHHFLKAYDLRHELDDATPETAASTPTLNAERPTLRVSLIVRRPYDQKRANGAAIVNAHGRDRLDRQFHEEAGLIAALESLSGSAAVDGAPLAIEVVDFAASPTLRDQLAVGARSDVIIGAHGAGLSHVLWMPDHAGVLEIRGQSLGWYCFAHMAEWRGLVFALWEYSRDQTIITHDAEYIKLDPNQFRERAAAIIKQVFARKKAAIQTRLTHNSGKYKH